MLLEWSGYPSEQRRQQNKSMISIAKQHFAGARSIVLFFRKSYKHTETRTRTHKVRCITTLTLNRYATAVASIFAIPI